MSDHRGNTLQTKDLVKEVPLRFNIVSKIFHDPLLKTKKQKREERKNCKIM